MSGSSVGGRPSPALVVALLALFVALCGSAIAANEINKLGKNSVRSKHIKNNTVKSQDLRDGGVGSADLAAGSITDDKLSPALVEKINRGGTTTTTTTTTSTPPTTTTPDTSTPASAELADGEVTTAKLADGSVTTPKLADGAVTGAKLAGNAVDASKIIDDSIGSAEIIDHGLDGDDISIESGNLASYDAPLVPADSCISNPANTGTGADMTDAVLLATPDSNWPDNLSVSTEDSTIAGSFRVTMCNPTAVDIDPPATTLHFIAFLAVD